MQNLSEKELSNVSGGFVPFAVQAAIYMAGQAASIYGAYKAAKWAGEQ